MDLHWLKATPSMLTEALSVFHQPLRGLCGLGGSNSSSMVLFDARFING
jgi:hypothetical protein